MSRIYNFVVENVRMLQALAAVCAIFATGYQLFLKPYLSALPPALAKGYVSVPCKKLEAITGDTVSCDNVAMREMGDGAPYKTGIDAPDVASAKCDKERELGVKSRDRMSQLLVGLDHVEDSGARDPSDRPLIKVRLKNGRTAGSVLVSEDLATVWFPGYKAHWCD